ncbi:CBU_0592 family membrane protein [Corynebacterium guangdongense]|uniref:CBU-0592-like domain-containing protein n=1 Tax=Corynebacterium guangdongense TaxID=1783348 RepID=A0ABU1ZXJ5_9CORY|nr:transporter [Corynebacterium guangdongense]MDR7329083.1 hypothetical protein [Corynebacterium guangdongense]WJZ17652.1 hypothetical protein CGUA_05340 [Corynebacterium guangdongense]
MSAMVIFGLIASAVLLLAFAMLNLGKWTTDDYPYQILNFLGAGFLAASAANPFNAGVFFTEIIWSALGLYGVVKIWRARRQAPVTVPDRAPATV